MGSGIQINKVRSAFAAVGAEAVGTLCKPMAFVPLSVAVQRG